jgi:parallel beta-helix repeat protein
MKNFATKKSPLSSAIIFSLSCFPPAIFSQGVLAPPGAPAPTMKSLDQIEARTIVNSNNTPGDAISLFKITNSGSYYFTGNITGVSGKHGIVIAAPNVTLDLNGFFLTGVPGSLNGISATNVAPLYPGLIVRNGTITGWGLYGIDTQFGAEGAVFSKLVLQNNGTSGGAFGGLRGSRSVVSDCVAQNNIYSYGLLGNGMHFINCVAAGGDQGFGAFFGSELDGCVSKDNFYGVDAENSSVRNCTIYNSTTDGIYVRSNCRIIGNLVAGNGHGTGIYVVGSANIIDGNTTVSNSTAGISLLNASATGNLMIRNTAHGNVVNYYTGSGNSFGPIVNAISIGDISSNTNASHPWANFSY